MKKLFVVCSAILFGICCAVDGGSLAPELAMAITIPVAAGAVTGFIKSDLYE